MQKVPCGSCDSYETVLIQDLRAPSYPTAGMTSVLLSCNQWSTHSGQVGIIRKEDKKQSILERTGMTVSSLKATETTTVDDRLCCMDV